MRLASTVNRLSVTTEASALALASVSVVLLPDTGVVPGWPVTGSTPLPPPVTGPRYSTAGPRHPSLPLRRPSLCPETRTNSGRRRSGNVVLVTHEYLPRFERSKYLYFLLIRFHFKVIQINEYYRFNGDSWATTTMSSFVRRLTRILPRRLNEMNQCCTYDDCECTDRMTASIRI